MSLESLRGRLDGIDRQLMQLVAERQQVIRAISEAKQATGLPLRDYRREREVFDKGRSNAAELGISPDVAEALLRVLVRYSLTVQERASMHAHGAGSGKRALVIGGAGKMGNWFAQFLYTQGFDVEISDPDAVAGDADIVDWTRTTLDHDFIVVATPLAATNDVLLQLAARRPTGMVFDIGSLKTPLQSGLAALRAAGVRTTSVHPMFGPDAELLSGRHVILIDLGDAETLERVGALFRPTMVELIVMKLDEHDHAAAYLLGMTHALNIAFLDALQRSGESAPRMMQLSSTTFGAQFDIARRVSTENPQLYHSIQHLNRFGSEALTALADAVDALRVAARDPDNTRFVQIMTAGRKYAEDRRRNGARSR